MSIYGLHIPYDETVSVTKVLINQRAVTNYYPYTQGGPAEAGYLDLDGVEVNAYVNSRYSSFGVEMVNKRATVLFVIAGTGMWGGAVRGDALLVGLSDGSGYETSLSPDFFEFALALDWSAFTEHVEISAH